MSQTSQAQTTHESACSDLQELRSSIEAVREKVNKGDLSPDEGRTELDRLKVETDAIRMELQTARDLAEDARSDDQSPEELDSEMRDGAEYLGGPDAHLHAGEIVQAVKAATRSSREREELTSADWGFRPEELSRAARAAGVAPSNYRRLVGQARDLTNNLLRNPRRSDEFAEAKTKLEELGLNPYVDRDGGQVVAQEIRNEIISFVRNRRHIRGRARVIPTNAETVAFPSYDLHVSLKKAMAHKGKIDGSGARTVRDILGKTQFTPHLRTEAIKVPEQLIEDATFDIVAFLAEEIAMEAFEDEENDFINGDGVNAPFGVLEAPILEDDMSGAALGPDKIRQMPYLIREAFRDGATYMGSRDFYREVTIMRTDEGGVGTGPYLWAPAMRAGDPPTLNGYEALESEFFPSAALGGSASSDDVFCLFGQWRQYWIVDRQGLAIKVLDQINAIDMQIVYRYTKRLDGAPVRPEAFAKLSVGTA